MQNTESLFHRLQKEGTKALEVANVKDDVQLSAEPFIAKVENKFKDPFLIFVVPLSAAVSISNRFDQIFATAGILINEDFSRPDRRAALDLQNEEMCNALLPARRFGVELYNNNYDYIGMVFEAMKDERTPFGPGECDGRRIKDCHSFRIHFLMPPDDVPVDVPEGPISLFNYSFKLKIENFSGKNLEVQSVTHNGLVNDAINVRSAPYKRTTRINPEELFSFVINITNNEYGASVIGRSQTVFQLLWALEREPKLILKETDEFGKENRSRRFRGKPQYSYVHILKIDREELRRVEFHRATEIATALAEKGRYKIPDLVLVSGYDRQDSGNRVEDYARCADELVRREATRLLQAKNYDELAELVSNFGNRTTQARLTSSDTFVVRMVQTPKND